MHDIRIITRKPAGRPPKRRRKGGIDADAGDGSVPRGKKIKLCRRCGETAKSGWRFCPYDGVVLPAAEIDTPPLTPEG